MCPLLFLINQCKIITFLILKSDIIEKSRIELRGVVLPVPSNHLLLFYPSTWYICDFFLFHIEIERNGGWIIGGGAKDMLAPSQIIGVGGCPPPPLFLRLCYYFHASRREADAVDRVFFSLYAQIRLLIVAFKNKYGQRSMLRKRFIFQTLKATKLFI